MKLIKKNKGKAKKSSFNFDFESIKERILEVLLKIFMVISSIMIIMSVGGWIVLICIWLFTDTNPFEKKKNIAKDTLVAKIISEERVRTFTAKEKFGEIVKGVITCDEYIGMYNENNIKIDSVCCFFENCNYKKKYLNNKVLEIVSYKNDGTDYFKETYKYDINGNEIENCYYWDNKISSMYKNKFDAVNRKIESCLYSKNGDLQTKTKIKYDKYGNEVEYIVFNKEGKIQQKNTHIYDLKGNIIEFTIIENDEWAFQHKKQVYSYDSISNLIERREYYYKNGKFLLNETEKHKYVKNTNIESKIIRADGTLKLRSFNKGNLLSTYDYNNFGNVLVKTDFKYDSYGNLIEEKSKNLINRWVYFYDKYRNWTKIIKFRNGKALTIKIRELKYLR